MMKSCRACVQEMAKDDRVANSALICHECGQDYRLEDDCEICTQGMVGMGYDVDKAVTVCAKCERAEDVKGCKDCVYEAFTKGMDASNINLPCRSKCGWKARMNPRASWEAWELQVTKLN